jgi:hypothetical protein
MIAENRKKYNLSCGDAIENKSKTKDNIVKSKKKLINNKAITKGVSKKSIVKPQ